MTSTNRPRYSADRLRFRGDLPFGWEYDGGGPFNGPTGFSVRREQRDGRSEHITVYLGEDLRFTSGAFHAFSGEQVTHLRLHNLDQAIAVAARDFWDHIWSPLCPGTTTGEHTRNAPHAPCLGCGLPAAR